VLANTEVLHEKIGELATRVRQLEDGLAQSHALHSLQPHPLLAPELLNIKRPLERERLDAPPKQEKPDTNSNEGVDAMGSLYVASNPSAGIPLKSFDQVRFRTVAAQHFSGRLPIPG
jgi:hypothetical protein